MLPSAASIAVRTPYASCRSLLPLTYPNGDVVPEALLELIEAELCEVFGGVANDARGSARGLSKKGHQLRMDSMVVLEVMTQELDKDWWKEFRHRTQTLFRQNELDMRAIAMERL